MKTLSIIFILMSFFQISFSQSKSASGTYQVKGRLFYEKSIAALDTIVIDSVQHITDLEGRFDFYVSWFGSEGNRKSDRNQLTIQIEICGKIYLFKNKWKKYGLRKFKRLEKQVAHLDFIIHKNGKLEIETAGRGNVG